MYISNHLLRFDLSFGKLILSNGKTLKPQYAAIMDLAVYLILRKVQQMLTVTAFIGGQ